jgi:Dihaem cytochrome c
VTIVLWGLVLGVPSCTPKSLPEEGTAVEQLYSERCGSCHHPYLPSSMTSAMWAMQVEAMQLKMVQAGRAPLTDSEKREILDYLQRNAGNQ